MRIKFDKLVLAIAVVVTIAYFFPQYGTGANASVINKISAIGIALIFFFYGLKLSPSKLKSGLSNWKLHVLIQCSTFVIFPVLVLLLRPLIQNSEQEIV